MKNKKNVAIALITAALTIGGLSLAKAKMYKHHYQNKTGHYEKGHEKRNHCGSYFKNSKDKKIEQAKE